MMKNDTMRAPEPVARVKVQYRGAYVSQRRGADKEGNSLASSTGKPTFPLPKWGSRGALLFKSEGPNRNLLELPLLKR